MPNTSATGGYLAPSGGALPEDSGLDAIFQALTAGVTGLAGQYVRPRWQSNAPKQPEANTDWCAIGVTVQNPDAGPYIKHDGTGNGHDDFVRHEDIELLATFYGPNSQQNAAILRDGLGISQNNEAINAAGFAFVDAGVIRTAPEFYNQQWIRRHDITLRFRRKVARTYPILNIISVPDQLIADSGLTVSGITQ